MSMFRSSWGRWAGVSVAVGALGLVGGSATAWAAETVLIDGQGFESPAYGLGGLTGQSASTFDGTGSVPWATVTGVGSTAVVQDAVVFSGSQAVEMNRGANEEARWAVPITGAPSERFVNVAWDMRVEQSQTQGFGPLFGIEAYDDSGAGVLRIGTLGVDAATMEVLVIDPSGIVVVDVDPLTPGEWNHFRLELDFAMQMFSSYLNGVLVDTTDFESLGVTGFTDADIAALSAGGDPESLGATGTAYFDNYRVYETSVPEPATAGLLVAGLGLALRRRRVA